MVNLEVGRDFSGTSLEGRVLWKRQYWETRRQQEKRKTSYEMDQLRSVSDRHESTGAEQDW